MEPATSPVTRCLLAESIFSPFFQHNRLTHSGSTKRSAVSSKDHVTRAERQATSVTSTEFTFRTKFEYCTTKTGPITHACCLSSADLLDKKLVLLSTPLSDGSEKGREYRELSLAWLLNSDMGPARSYVVAANCARMAAPRVKPFRVVSWHSGGRRSSDHASPST